MLDHCPLVLSSVSCPLLRDVWDACSAWAEQQQGQQLCRYLCGKADLIESFTYVGFLESVKKVPDEVWRPPQRKEAFSEAKIHLWAGGHYFGSTAIAMWGVRQGWAVCNLLVFVKQFKQLMEFHYSKRMQRWYGVWVVWLCNDKICCIFQSLLSYSVTNQALIPHFFSCQQYLYKLCETWILIQFMQTFNRIQTSSTTQHKEPG